MLSGDKTLVSTGSTQKRLAYFVAADGNKAIVEFLDSGIEARVPMERLTELKQDVTVLYDSNRRVG